MTHCELSLQRCRRSPTAAQESARRSWGRRRVIIWECFRHPFFLCISTRPPRASSLDGGPRTLYRAPGEIFDNQLLCLPAMKPPIYTARRASPASQPASHRSVGSLRPLQAKYLVSADIFINGGPCRTQMILGNRRGRRITYCSRVKSRPASEGEKWRPNPKFTRSVV